MLRNKFGFARAHSLQARPIAKLIIVGTIALGIGALGHRPRQDNPAAAFETAAAGIESALPAPVEKAADDMAGKSMQLLAASHAAAQTALGPKPQTEMREITLGHGETLGDLLQGSGVGRVDTLAASAALRKVYDPHGMPAGQRLHMVVTRTGTATRLDGFAFQPDATHEMTVIRNKAGTFTADAQLVPVVQRHFAAEGEIHSSLYEAGTKAGVPHAIMASLIHIYSHEIDFQRDIHPGDHFKVLYEQPVTRSGAAVGDGTIIYASLDIDGTAKPIYRVTFPDHSSDYFDAKGHSIRRTLLRTPISAVRITSGFGPRVDPILGYSGFHPGVDFGAPRGTPIFAAGDGVIEQIGWDGGYGRCVKIRHNGRLETVYGHMNRFAKNMYRGARVKQGQVIGYVGSTGHSTGPHLHFEVRIAGRPVNPLTVDMPAGRELKGRMLVAFRQGETHIGTEFSDLLAKGGYSLVKASAPAFGIREVKSCGLRGGC